MPVAVSYATPDDPIGGVKLFHNTMEYTIVDEEAGIVEVPLNGVPYRIAGAHLVLRARTKRRLYKMLSGDVKLLGSSLSELHARASHA